ncbi:ABC transporter ATP-binding protein [Legionella longbeachae]|uniref:Putative ABC transporter, ATP-binding protein n=1 Tax=Legionella longbeachae serogroup 1 (strain NSW150) TaxID=661367 RepID=D3HPG0_LEGLN|nr:ABC transporter ATP-binding protein [Legionella longbeachae]VEE01300.1 ABC transporter ATP-binding protein [Legionella oakridgensis]HBD7398264.1 ABC transporter ATP-binding protein [Legionella pneumophila]ARB92335.1 ABC transporter ATP-binding protein [Legionella longbeachae]ARM34484.1 ABC transporter ATP-binding protein [Legionella longbeachae]EEZ96223.1 ABC-type multidrug transport system protein [Legionella longbeachae D-4968]
MSDLAIDVKELTKKFDEKVAVDHISLKVEKGSIFGFLGSNGSGKTTTIRMICGLLTPTDGEGSCLGYNIRTQSNHIKQNTGYMPQKFSFYTGLTVYENLRFIADIFQIKNSAQEIKDIIQDLGLEKYRKTQAGRLSGGWKQRLALACSILHKPSLLFLDEPTAGVDPKARKEFWDYLHEITARDGTTILVTTHYMDEAEKCTDLAYINLGKLLYTGATKNLIPSSKVKTFILEADRKEQNLLIKKVNHSYPELLASIVNNELRISSRNHQAMDKLIQENKNLSFKGVTPSFEEVFIGLMQ